MRKVKFKESIEAHPHGRRERFNKGDELEVADNFAKLVVEKGHAVYADDQGEDVSTDDEGQADDQPRRRGRPRKQEWSEE